MDTFDRKSSDLAADKTTEGRPYEPPLIAWREPYEPVAFGISCAFQAGNPGCSPGPFQA